MCISHMLPPDLEQVEVEAQEFGLAPREALVERSCAGAWGQGPRHGRRGGKGGGWVLLLLLGW